MNLNHTYFMEGGDCPWTVTTFGILFQHKFDPVADNFSSRVCYLIEVRTGNINEKAIKTGRSGSLAGEDGFRLLRPW